MAEVGTEEVGEDVDKDEEEKEEEEEEVVEEGSFQNKSTIFDHLDEQFWDKT